MDTEMRIFDPEGDIILILSQPVLGNGKEGGNADGEASAVTEIVPRPHHDTPMSHAPEEEEDGPATDTVMDFVPDICVHMLVSSRHMQLASPVFKAMLQTVFKEGLELKSTGKVQIPLPDDHSSAFTIILSIIHGRNRQVPKKVDFTLLLEIAILVDKYQMHEVVENKVEQWMRDTELLATIPQHACENLQPWLCISWVFRLIDVLKPLTQIAVLESASPLGKDVHLHLPIPTIILETIDNWRLGAITSLLRLVSDLVQRLQGPESECNAMYLADTDTNRFTCSGMMLGTLLKSASERNVWPLPLTPYAGWSFDALSIQVRSLGIKSLCENPHMLSGLLKVASESRPHQEATRASLLKSVKRIRKTVARLDMGLLGAQV